MQILNFKQTSFSTGNQKSNNANSPSFKSGLSFTPEAVNYYKTLMSKKETKCIEAGYKKVKGNGVNVFLKPYEHDEIKNLFSIHILPENVENFLTQDLPRAWEKFSAHISGNTQINLRKDGKDVEYLFTDQDANIVGELGSICGHPETIAEKNKLEGNNFKKDLLDYNLEVLAINHTHPKLYTDVDAIGTSAYNPTINTAFEDLLYDSAKRQNVVQELIGK